MEALPVTRWSRGPIGPGWFMMITEVKPLGGGGGGAAWRRDDPPPKKRPRVRDHRGAELLALLMLDEE